MLYKEVVHLKKEEKETEEGGRGRRGRGRSRGRGRGRGRERGRGGEWRGSKTVAELYVIVGQFGHKDRTVNYIQN